MGFIIVRADSSSFSLVLPNLVNPGGLAPDDEVTGEVSADVALTGKYDKKILSFCFGQSRDAKAVADCLGLRYSTHLRKDIIQKLVDSGLLRKTEVNGKTLYQTNKDRVRIVRN